MTVSEPSEVIQPSIPDCGQSNEQSAPQLSDPSRNELIEAIQHAEAAIMAHLEEFHDFDYPPHDVPLEVASLRDIQHHLAGSMVNRRGEFVRAEGSSRTETAFDILEQNCWDLRCVDIPTGAGDADIGWQIVEHHMAPPKERIIGYGNAPLDALMDAMSRGPK